MAVMLSLLVAVQAATVGYDAAASPVTKVVGMLKDMRAQLEKEGEEDAEVYQKVKCWCTVNNKDKTQAISDAESRINMLTSTIEAKTADGARLRTEIKNLNSEVAHSTESLAKATEMRRKELKEFTAEEKDALASIGALKNAVTVLGKHHESLVQMPSEALLNLVALVEDQLAKNQPLVNSITTPSQKQALKAFVKAPAEFFTQTDAAGKYAPQSGAIFGILKQMKETFQTNLASSQHEEQASQEEYESLKAAKTAEITAGQEQSDAKAQELANADEQLAQASQDKEDTENALASDIKFLANLKETCKMTDSEFEIRSSTRAEEVTAVSEALAILSSDDARDTFTRTLSFVQVSAGQEGEGKRAAAVLYIAAKAAGSPQLAAIASAAATATKLDAFTKVTASINQMIAELQQQKKDEIMLRDSCLKELEDNSRAQENKQRDMGNLDAEIADLTQTVAGLGENIGQLKAEIAEMQTQRLHAGQDREVENNDFQLTVADQRATQQLVSKALDSLNKFYAKKDHGAGFVQTKAAGGPPPPAGFKTYKKNTGGGGVIGMLEGVVAEAKQLEQDAISAETDAQKAYEQFVRDSNESIDLKNRDITSKTAEKAEKTADQIAAEENLAAAKNEQSQNEATASDLHKSCDFTLNNFSARQAANDQEVGALREAKSILQGSGMKLFLQK